MSKICTMCGISKSFSEFNKATQHPTGFRPECRKCQKNASQDYYLGHREEVLTRGRAHYSQNRKRLLADSASRNRTIREEAINAYGKICICCGESEIEFLTVDHIAGGGRKHRQEVGSGTKFYRWLKVNNYPDGFQILCMNCNWSKGRLGCCPHDYSYEKVSYGIV